MLADCIEEFQPANILREPARRRDRLRQLAPPARLDHRKRPLRRRNGKRRRSFAEKYAHADEGVRQGGAFRSIADGSKALPFHIRYEARLERSYKRAIKTLEDLRASRARRQEP